MNEENNEEVIKNYDNKEKNNNSLLQIILTIILTILLVLLTLIAFPVSFIILWIISSETANKDNVFCKAYNVAFKITGILVIVGLIAFGACTILFLGW